MFDPAAISCHRTDLCSALRDGQTGPMHTRPTPPEATEQTSAVAGVPWGLGGVGTGAG